MTGVLNVNIKFTFTVGLDTELVDGVIEVVDNHLDSFYIWQYLCGKCNQNENFDGKSFKASKQLLVDLKKCLNSFEIPGKVKEDTVNNFLLMFNKLFPKYNLVDKEVNNGIKPVVELVTDEKEKAYMDNEALKWCLCHGLNSISKRAQYLLQESCESEDEIEVSIDFIYEAQG